MLTKPTGTTNYALNLLPHLKKIEPIVLTSQSLPNYNCYYTPVNQTSEQGFEGHLRRLLWIQFQLPKIYGELKSQLLFSPISEAPLWSKCRSVIMAHDFIPLRFPKKFSPLTAYHQYYVPQVLIQSEHIVCNSQSTAKDIVEFCHITASKITPILLAYDSNHFRPLGVSQLRSQTHQYFLYIGRHDPYKNISRLFSAFANLRSSHEYQLWLAGPSDNRYTPALKKQAKELGITDQVKFLDYVPYDDLPKIISGAIALVFPSLWEGFGLPVLEAMACGTPVITSNLSSLPEVAGNAAILIDPYKVEEITDGMQAIANDAGLRSHLSELGLARASLFSWEKTGQETAEVLKRFM
ncbi:glycosyl transferase, group 1 [Pseudanabaena sp. lw0831]|nr:glycosyl transferase, group 1 [Pseudanabaena sp. lw0831]